MMRLGNCIHRGCDASQHYSERKLSLKTFEWYIVLGMMNRLERVLSATGKL